MFTRELLDRLFWAVMALLWLYWTAAALGGCADMPKTDYGISGLNTAPNPQAAVPPGALADADNVVIRRAGMAEPRPGFRAGTDTTLAAIWKLIPYDGDFFAVGTAGATRWSNATLTDAVFDKHYARAVEARKNLYLTTSDSVRKFTAALDTTADRAGLQPPPGIAVSAATGTNLLDTYSYAWRFLVRRTDANNVVVRSAPSSRSILYNNAGATKSASLFCYIGASLGFVAGDVIELYRSYGSTVPAQPSDEMFLVSEYTLAAGDITNGYAVIADTLVDANLGVALYTNATQEGIRRENRRPPRARDLALYQGSVFAADITYPHDMELSFTQPLAALTASATGIGSRTYTGTRTNASNQITGMSSVVGLKVGQLLLTGLGSWGGTLPVRITAIVGTTLTMSETWGGATDGAPASQTLVDSVRISVNGEDKYYPSGSVSTIALGITIDTAFRVTHSVNVGARAVGDGWAFDASAALLSTRGTLEIFQLTPTGGAFQVWATHGSEYSPPLPEPTVGSGLSSTQDVFPNGLAWSKEDEPEHFMEGQIWLVGNARAPILRVVALKDALYVFKGKGDGIYRLSGFGELTGWNVTQLDATTYLLHPELVTVLEDMAYAWTNTGLCEVSAAGAPMISGPILDQTGQQEITLDSSSATHAYAFAAANLPDHEIIVGLPSSDTDNQAPANTWVYNTFTKAWTEWFGNEGSPNTMVLNPKTNLLLKAGQNAGVPGIARNASSDTIHGADLETVINVLSISSLNVVITGASGWTPAVGDLVQDGNTTYATVTAITDATHFTVDVPIITGAAIAYRAFLSTVTWLPKVDPSGAVLKQFIDVVTHWDDVFGLQRWTQELSGARNTTPAALAYTRTMARTHARAETRAMLPRSVAKDQQLYITLKVKSAGSEWRVSGVSENANIVGTRVAR